MIKRFILTFTIALISFFSNASSPLTLTENLHEICLCRELVEYYEDTTGNFSLSEIRSLNQTLFTESNAADLINDNLTSAYWLKFKLINQTDKPFRIELFDFDLDEISLFIPDEQGVYREQKAGYVLPFEKREINHKNVSFRIILPKGVPKTLFMRFKSRRHNVLEPIVRSYDTFLDYGFTEYLLFGLFYGLLLLMIFYNLLYFILLRKNHFLYYVLFGSGILLYLVAKNGIGFQFLWPSYPQFNSFAGPIGLYIGIVFMLFFAYTFLHLDKKGAIHKKFFYTAVAVRTLLFGVQLYCPDCYKWQIADIFFIQLTLLAGIWRYFYKPAKWYIIAFTLLDISFLVSGLEQAGLIASSPITVYSFYIGIIVNFLFLSIATGESIQETYQLKTKAHAQLILEYKKNAALKEKINKELEQLVKDRTLILQLQNMEIQKQKEQIKEMYENLEELVKKRTIQLEDSNTRIKEYSFSNSHLVRGPLARILGLINVIKIENKATDDLVVLLEMIEKSAIELDDVVREMSRILDTKEHST